MRFSLRILSVLRVLKQKMVGRESSLVASHGWQRFLLPHSSVLNTVKAWGIQVPAALSASSLSFDAIHVSGLSYQQQGLS